MRPKPNPPGPGPIRKPCASCTTEGRWYYAQCGECRKPARDRSAAVRLHRVRRRIGPPQALPHRGIVDSHAIATAQLRGGGAGVQRLAAFVGARSVHPLDIARACDAHRVAL